MTGKTENRINFYRGVESRYIDPDAVPRDGADVAFYPRFINGIFFAKDTGMIYINGKRYGTSSSFSSMNPFSDTSSDILKYKVKVSNGTTTLAVYDSEGKNIDNVKLFRIYSGTPNTLKIDIDKNNDYRISLNLKDSVLSDSSVYDNRLVCTDNRFGVFLGMINDVSTNTIRFGSYDCSGNFLEFGSIYNTGFLEKSDLDSIMVTKNAEDASVLRFVWNDDATHKGLNTVVDIPLWDFYKKDIEEIRKYMINGKKISENPVLEGCDISVGDSSVKENDVTFSSDDDIATAIKKLNCRLNTIENQNVVPVTKTETDSQGLVWKDYFDNE